MTGWVGVDIGQVFPLAERSRRFENSQDAVKMVDANDFFSQSKSGTRPNPQTPLAEPSRRYENSQNQDAVETPRVVHELRAEMQTQW